MKPAEFLNRIESKKKPLWFWVGAIFFVIVLRLVLEHFLEKDHSALFPENFMHYLVAFLALYFLFVLVLSFLAKEKIEKTSKVVLAFWPIILLAPIIDFIASGGQGYHLTYLIGSPEFLAQQFFSFFESAGNFGASIGIRIELIFALVLAPVYVFIKTKKILKTVLAPIVLYCFVFVYAALPSLLLLLNGIRIERPMFLGEHVAFFMLTTALAFNLLLFLSLVFWLYFFDKKKLCAVTKNLSIPRALHYVFMALIGGKLFEVATGMPQTWLATSSVCLAAFLAFEAAKRVNDFFDRKADKINGKNFSEKNALNAAEEKWLWFFCFFLFALFSFFTEWQAMVLLLGSFGIGLLYSVPPLRLKRFPFVSTFCLALISCFVALAGFTAQGASIALFPVNIFLLLLVAFTLAFNFKDLADMKGDMEEKIFTLPVLLGKEKAKKIISLLVFFSFVIAPIFLEKLFLLPASLGFGFVTFFLVLKQKGFENYLIVLYLAFLVLLSFFL